MTSVKVGQVWQDKDARRNTVIEILSLHRRGEGSVARALVVGTEQEREYSVSRLTKRWNLLADKNTDTEKEVDLEIDRATGKAPKPKKVIIPIKNRSGSVDEDSVTTEKITRELWLEKAVDLIKEAVFPECDVPTVRVSVGWPGGRGPKSKTIGQCWKSTTATDKVSQIFISPVLSDPIKVLETLVHEIIHAIDDTESGHKGRFASIARAVGLDGKLTATHAGAGLREQLEEISKELGEYPHAAINVEDKPKPHKTYLLKYVSPEEPDYFLRITQTKIEEYGAPRDPWGNEMELEN